MKYIKTYEEFRLNEGILGDVLNFFKGIWKKVAVEMQKLNDDPNKIKEYITNNTLSATAPNSVIKQELDKFNADRTKDKTINNDNVFNLIDGILNKDTGILGKQGIDTLFADKSLQGDKMKVKRLSFEFIINTARDQMITNIKFNPKEADKKKYIENLKIGVVLEKRYFKLSKNNIVQVNEEEKQGQSGTPPENTTATDTDKLKENIEAVIKWFNDNITANLVKFAKAVREDDIKAAVAKGGANADTEYKVGDLVRYKRDKYVEGTDEDKQPKDAIGSLKINKIDGDKYTFIDNKNIPFTKTKEQILGKVEGDDSHGTEDEKELKDTLSKMKDNPEQMKTMNQLADLYIKDPGKIEQLLKSQTNT
jgi:hypothetical protein